MEDHQARQWGMLCHLAALSVFVGIPFGRVLGPLVIWLIKKDEHPYIAEQGKESLNFQLSMTLYLFCSGILVLIVIGILALFVLYILDIVLVIIASVKISNGEEYHYPFTIRFLK